MDGRSIDFNVAEDGPLGKVAAVKGWRSRAKASKSCSTLGNRRKWSNKSDCSVFTSCPLYRQRRKQFKSNCARRTAGSRIWRRLATVAGSWEEEGEVEGEEDAGVVDGGDWTWNRLNKTEWRRGLRASNRIEWQCQLWWPHSTNRSLCCSSSSKLNKKANAFLIDQLNLSIFNPNLIFKFNHNLPQNLFGECSTAVL